MTQEQIAISVVLVATMLLFGWGRWRYDLVAMFALVSCVLLRLIDPAGRLYRVWPSSGHNGGGGTDHQRSLEERGCGRRDSQSAQRAD